MRSWLKFDCKMVIAVKAPWDQWDYLFGGDVFIRGPFRSKSAHYVTMCIEGTNQGKAVFLSYSLHSLSYFYLYIYHSI